MFYVNDRMKIAVPIKAKTALKRFFGPKKVSDSWKSLELKDYRSLTIDSFNLSFWQLEPR